MCWNWEVSALFALYETVLIVVIVVACWKYPAFHLHRYGQPPSVKNEQQCRRLLWAVPFCITINLVEWSEVFIWLSAPQAAAEALAVPTMNMLWTGLAGMAVTAQPLVCAVFFYKTHELCDFYRNATPTLTQEANLRVVAKEKAEKEMAAQVELEEQNWTIGAASEPEVELSRRRGGAVAEEEEAGSGAAKVAPSGVIGKFSRVVTDVSSAMTAGDMWESEAGEEERVALTGIHDVDHGKYPERDRFLLVYLSALFTTGLLWLGSGWVTLYPDHECTYNPHYFASMMNSCTCSFVGEYGHLHWTFAFPCRLIHFLPNFFPYALFANLAAVFYAPVWVASPMFFSLPLFLWELVWFWGSPEAYSVWCWTGMAATSMYGCFAGALYMPGFHEYMMEQAGFNGTILQFYVFVKDGVKRALNQSPHWRQFWARFGVATNS